MDPMTQSALITGAAGVLGGIQSISGSKDMAKNQRRFITKQMQNAHQWEVADLRAAGLNPILSAGGGGARGGTMASPTIPDIISPAMNSALATRRLKQELRNMSAVENKDDSQAALNVTQGQQSKMQQKIMAETQKLVQAQLKGQNIDNEQQSEILKGLKLEGDIDETKVGEWGRILRRILPFYNAAKPTPGRR